MSDFEELTSLTALIDDEAESSSKPPTKQPKTTIRQTKSGNIKAKSKQAGESKAKEAKPKQRKRKRYTSSHSPEQLKPAADEGPKVMTSIILSEELRDWLKLQSLSTKLSMSQQIELLVRREMKRQAKD